ncbi:MAG: NADH dehydrogenase subunit, partial [Mucinivorans sp.]
MMAEEHIVKVGPVHAGIIEPGVFRFVCSGEKVLKVDLELGFQHRAIEHQIVASHGNVWRMMALAE